MPSKKDILTKDIKQLNDFAQLWQRFEDTYKGLFKKPNLDRDDEAIFIDTKDLLLKRFELLTPGIKGVFAERTFDNIMEKLLTFDKISSLSESQKHMLEDDLKYARIILDNVIHGYELKLKVVSETHPAVWHIKRVLLNPLALIAVAVFLFILYYMIMFLISR